MKNLSEQFIGRAERHVGKILRHLFPEMSVSTQMPLWTAISDEDFLNLGEEFKKHKFDFVMYNGPMTIVIEVNYKHGEKAAQKWSDVFAPLIRKAGKIPVTIEDYNCEVLFSDSLRDSNVIPWGAYIDVIRELERNHVGPDGTLFKM